MTDTRSYAFKAEELLLECVDLLDALKLQCQAPQLTQRCERLSNRIDTFLETFELPTVQ